MAGFSLVELMVAVAIGLVLSAVMSVVYINSRGASTRQTQLSGLQQGVRTAFEYVAFDSRMVGHLGCFTGHAATELVTSGALDLSNNFQIGVEGYEYTGTAPSDTYALTSTVPTDTTSASEWSNSSTATTASIPLSSITGGSGGLTPGSDVLIVRSAAVGRPVRLAAAVAGGSATTIPLDNRSTGTCPDGTANLSGFCTGSFGVIASCTSAQTFRVAAVSGTNLTLGSALQGSVVYSINASEVFPMQTVVYYVKRSSSNTTTSLYRRVMDGAQNQEQELVEGVESMQVRYARDLDTEPDGQINGDYVTANNVGDWSKVLAIRVSLVMRSQERVASDIATTTPLVANGTTFTQPTTGTKFDRRVFTTTVALRNRITYAVP